MLVSKKLASALMLSALSIVSTRAAQAEVTLGEAAGWTVSTDGRVNAFISHVYGEPRPAGLENLSWVGFNESGVEAQVNSDNKLQKTKIRSGYVPSTLAFNFRKQISPQLKVASRVEVGIQITNIDPAFIADPTWMEPRAVYLDLSGGWGSVRAGRDFSLFSRGNLFMNYELGHAYGLGFPCAYDKMFGGACGHVGFGTLWPDFRAQLTYTTPKIGNVAALSVGVFDPRGIITYEWLRTPLPRIEAEAVAEYDWKPGWGFKAWANAFHQVVGTTASVDGGNGTMVRKDFTLNAYGVGGGVRAALGALKAGVSGYTGQGMDAFSVMTFNPIFVGQRADVPNHERKFRPSRGLLAQASLTFGNTWVMGGFGQAYMDRVATDIPIDQEGAFPLIRKHTGISAGLFHRIESVVLALDYFNAHYSFDPNRVATGTTQDYRQASQTVNVFNAGVTLEW